jgi:hypothetical protein
MALKAHETWSSREANHTSHLTEPCRRVIRVMHGYTAPTSQNTRITILRCLGTNPKDRVFSQPRKYTRRGTTVVTAGISFRLNSILRGDHRQQW